MSTTPLADRNLVELGDLKPLGPITSFKLRWQPPGFDRRVVVEFGPYPDGSRIAELSTKCLASEALDVAFRTQTFPSQKGVELSGASNRPRPSRRSSTSHPASPRRETDATTSWRLNR